MNTSTSKRKAFPLIFALHLALTMLSERIAQDPESYLHTSEVSDEERSTPAPFDTDDDTDAISSLWNQVVNSLDTECSIVRPPSPPTKPVPYSHHTH